MQSWVFIIFEGYTVLDKPRQFYMVFLLGSFRRVYPSAAFFPVQLHEVFMLVLPNFGSDSVFALS